LKGVRTRCLGEGAGPDDTKFYRGHPLLSFTCRLCYMPLLIGEGLRLNRGGVLVPVIPDLSSPEVCPPRPWSLEPPIVPWLY